MFLKSALRYYKQIFTTFRSLQGQLLTKFQVPKHIHFEFPAKIVKNFWRAWQAYFLKNILQIRWEVISFRDVQMMWNDGFDISNGFIFGKNGWNWSVHF